MTYPTNSVVQRDGVSTRDADVLTELIRQMYAEHRPRFTARQPPPEFSVSYASVGPLRVDRITNSFHFSSVGDPMDYFNSFQLLGGRISIDDGYDEVRVQPGEGFLHRIGTAERADMADFDVAMVSMPLARLSAFAAEHTDIDAEDLRFEGTTPVSAAMSQYWSGVMSYLHRTLMDPGSVAAHPLIGEQLVNLTAAAALTVFPNTSMSTHRRSVVGQVPPAALRRAIAYIDAHAGEKITVTDIARAAGITPRALQQGFARHHETTPTAYLRRVRLEHAHRDLQAADPTAGDTVAAIAGRWGFAKPSRFATMYRNVYGRSPSHTLRT